MGRLRGLERMRERESGGMFFCFWDPAAVVLAVASVAMDVVATAVMQDLTFNARSHF